MLFFRDPERHPSGEGMISPADGKVAKINNREISILMNIHNVHVNRAPLEGVVKRISYVKGSFKPVFSSSNENERNIIILSTEHGDIRTTQLAGFITRRIVCYVKEGEKVDRGQRIGAIRFGSRVDVTVPPKLKIIIREGSKVKAGDSVIAR